MESRITEDQSENELADLSGLSLSLKSAVGPETGQTLRRIGRRLEKSENHEGQAVGVNGFSLHAGVSVKAGQKHRLKKLIRCTARGPLAVERLTKVPSGRLIYRLKTPWADGSTHISFSPMDFIARLVALIPPKGMNLIRYHGVFAPKSTWRKEVVPSRPKPIKASLKVDIGSRPNTARRSRLTWAEMLKRAFKINVTICKVCQGRFEPIAVIKSPQAIHAILTALGESSVVEPRPSPRRGPPTKVGSPEEPVDAQNADCDADDQRPKDW